MKAYIMGNYTEKAFQGFLKDPKSDRKAVVEQLTKAMGGTMHSMDIVRLLLSLMDIKNPYWYLAMMEPEPRLL